MITLKQMQVLERAAHKKGIFTKDLMQNAGKEVAKIIEQKFTLENSHVVLFANTGNNTGDGFACIKHLFEKAPAVILLFGKEENMGEETLENYNQIKETIPIIKINTKEDLDKFQFQDVNLIFIDALLGTGITGDLKDNIKLAINFFNEKQAQKIAIDIPSGLNPTTGEIKDKMCNVELIVALHDIKEGAVKFQDKTTIVDIGLNTL